VKKRILQRRPQTDEAFNACRWFLIVSGLKGNVYVKPKKYSEEERARQMLFSQNGTEEKAMDAIFVALKYKFDFARICRVNYRPFGDCCVSRRNAVGKVRDTVLDIACFCVVYFSPLL